MPGDSKRIAVAEIGAAHGIRGELRLRVFTADPAALQQYGPLTSEDGRSFVLSSVRVSGPNVIARLRGIDDRNAAERLRGLILTTSRDRLPAPEPDEFYHIDLIGLAAITRDGTQLGTVAAVHNFGAGDILEVTPIGEGAPLLVPFTRTAVPELDFASRRIVIDPPAEVDAEPDASGNARAE